MKRQWLLFAAVAMMTGCTAEMDQTGNVALETAESGKLTARIGDVETRVEFDEFSGTFSWSAGDQIDVHTTAGYQTTALDANGCFSLESGSVRDGYAVYPTGIVSGDSDLTVELADSYDIAAEGMVDFYPSPMIALNDPASDDLWFYHAGAVARLVFTELPAETRSILVTFDKRVTGAFTVADPGTDHPVIATDGAATGNTVRFNLSEAPAIPEGGFALNVPIPTGTYESISASIQDASQAELQSYTSAKSRDLPRARGRKIQFPEAFDYTFEATDPATLSYAGGLSDDGTVRSFRVHRKTGTVETVNWMVDGYFSDAACTTPYDGVDASHKPSWIQSIAGAGTGSATAAGESVILNYNHGDYEATRTLSPEGQAINDAIAATPVAGSPSQYLNLANPSNPSSDYVVESANCYIVNGAGYYRIPLVMGNGVINNAVNPSAVSYMGRSEEYMTQFKDYKGQNITTPYLSGIGTLYSAFVVWEDSEDLIEVVDDTDFVLSGTPVTQSGGMSWLNFHVAQAKQGNAVIAVTDAAGDVMWSWHIWVTNYVPLGSDDLDVTAYDGIHTYKMMPVNLGWNVSGMLFESRFLPGEVYVRLSQARSGNTAVLRIQQEGKAMDAWQYGNFAPYYQWGRKDALWPSNGMDAKVGGYGDNPLIHDNDDAVWYGRYKGLDNISSAVTLDVAIRNPGMFLGSESAQNWLVDESSNAMYAFNLWNAVEEPVFENAALMYPAFQKTIYDPCPAGYAVPTPGLFTTTLKAGASGAWPSYSGGVEAVDALLNVPNAASTVYPERSGMTFYLHQDADASTPVSYFPVSGCRKCKDGKVYNLSWDSYYWLCCHFSNSLTNSSYFYFCTDRTQDNYYGIRAFNNGKRSDGMMIRPVRY